MAGTVAQQESITHKRVLRIAVPIVLSNATVPILGAVDTGVVGQTGLAAPIGAVGLGAVMLGAFYWLFGFLRMGTVGLTAQAAGNSDPAEVSALLTRGLIIGLSAGVLVLALQLPLFWFAFYMAPASAEVETLARQYMAIRIWSAPAAISLYALTGWLIAQERALAVLVVQLAMNGTNILLDLWFVLGLELGVPGVAWATFIAEWSGAALALWFCRGVFADAAWRAWDRVFAATIWLRMFRVNCDILIRSALIEVIMLSFIFMGADMGDVTLAANQVLLQFVMITSYALDGFAFSAETLVGQAVGAKQRAMLRRAAAMSALWAGAMALLISIALALAGPALIDLISKSPEVQAEARVYLIYLIAVPLLGVGAFLLDGIFAGATRTRDMRNMMALSVLIYGLAAAIMVPVFGNHGLWAAMLVSFVARGVTLGLRYPALERTV
ncbi:MAG: MATE family efflux transporter [Pseudomonadota bacterium]